MKKMFLAGLFLLSFSAWPQNFSGRTSEIVLDTRNKLPDAVLPEITWISPRTEFSNMSERDLHVEAVFTSQVYLKDAKIVVSGAGGIIAEKKISVNAEALSQKIQLPVKLLEGVNVIELVCENVSGGKVSSSRTVTMGKDALADAVASDRKDYALFFATDKYDYWTDLVNPVNDAQTLATELSSRYGFNVEVVENPTLDEVFIKLREYAEKKFKPQDQLLVFFAGHGFFDDTFGEGYVVAKNSLENDKAKTSYISHNRLRSIINNIKSDHIFLAMDVCFGGTFDPVLARSRGSDVYAETSQNEFLVRKLSYKTRKYLTSGGKEYVSDGVAGHHSPFALKFLQALKESGGADRILTLPELKTYVEKLKPEPRFGSFGDDQAASDFVFVAKQ